MQTELNQSILKQMTHSAYKLSLFLLVCIILLLAVQFFTAPKIAHEEREAMLKTFNKIFPPPLYNNQPLEDTLIVSDPEQLSLLGSDDPVTLYRARKDNQPAGLIFNVVARNGYSSHISILIAVLPNGTLSGVRVLSHRETPGLGDKIEERKNDWILSFNGKSLHIPANQAANIEHDSRWAVKKDGGEFDQFTGATITPRAVIAAVKKGLLFVHQNGNDLYD